MKKANAIKTLIIGSAVALSAMTTGCASGLNTIQKAEYAQMEADGVLVEEKNPATATVLGVLPGFGSFYVEEYGVGLANLLLWPASILWDPISGNNGAKAINYQITKAKLKRDQAAEMSALEDELATGTIDNAEYVRQKQKIEAKYTYD